MMSFTRRLARLSATAVAFAMAVFLLMPLLTLAQAGAQVLINYPELREEGDGLNLGIYFNLTDSSGRVLTTAEPQSARILLDDGVNYDATVEKPTSPIFITLVLDASGSMGGAAESMRQAAIQAVNTAPEEAQFAVIRFNNAIDVLTEFTTDRNRVINAIGEVRPINLAGTCLYDATFRAIELMNTAPAGRRAIVLFTDGRDETAQGTVCSQHVFNEVVDFANRPESRVPVHTIGLSGGNSAINAQELRDIASSTGGLSAIGDQNTLGSLFGQIMDALRAQWLAQAIIYPSQGQHTAQLLITMADGSFPQPALVVFVSPRNFQRTPTITPTQPTATPTIVNVTVDSIAIDPAAETVSVQASVANEQLISEYRFEFKNENNLLQGVFVLPAPLQSVVTFPSRNLEDGDASLQIVALNSQGQVVARSEPYEFAYQGPTATPQPPTDTPEPISATLTSIQYNETTDVITLNISLLGQERMEQLQVNVVNGGTNLLEQTYRFDPAIALEVPSTGLRPGLEYVMNVIALGPNGQIISQSEREFVYSPLLTPTPTPLPPTDTPEPISASLDSIQYDETSDTITLNILLQRPDQIRELRVNVVDDDTNLLEASYRFDPATSINVPTTGLTPGRDYQIDVIAQGPTGQTFSSTNRRFTYSPLLTPTPTPVTVNIAISGINVPEAADEFIINIETQNETEIERYELRLVASESGLLVNNLEFDTPPYNQLRVPLTGMTGGQYEMRLNALAADGSVLASYVAEAVITLPTPTPTITPVTGLAALPGILRSNPLIAIVVVLVALALVLLLFLILRKPKQKTGTSFLSELTQVQQSPVKPGPGGNAPRKAPSGPPARGDNGDDKTNVTPYFGGSFAGGDTESTNVVAAMPIPPASLTISQTRDGGRMGQSITLGHVPYRLGRKGRDLNFEADDNVSRNHAEISYSDGTFYIMDEGSTHGTLLNGSRISPRTPVPLSSGARITLGTTTVLLFQTETTGSTTSYDVDSTNING